MGWGEPGRGVSPGISRSDCISFLPQPLPVCSFPAYCQGEAGIVRGADKIFGAIEKLTPGGGSLVHTGGCPRKRGPARAFPRMWVPGQFRFWGEPKGVFLPRLGRAKFRGPPGGRTPLFIGPRCEGSPFFCGGRAQPFCYRFPGPWTHPARNPSSEGAAGGKKTRLVRVGDPGAPSVAIYWGFYPAVMESGHRL